jgi:hypothetical protein
VGSVPEIRELISKVPDRQTPEKMSGFMVIASNSLGVVIIVVSGNCGSPQQV